MAEVETTPTSASALSLLWLAVKILIIVVLGSTEGIIPVYQGF